MEQHRIVVIGSVDENVALIKRAKERGYFTIVCDGKEKSHLKGIADKTYDIDVRDVDSIAKMCIEEKADGIVGAFSDLVFEQVTKIAAKAGLRWYASPEILDNYRDKFVQKTILNKLGISTPKFEIINNTNFDSVVTSIKFPVVVKPVAGWGSRDIAVFDTKEELRDYVDSLDDDIEYEIEEYCDAFEYNCISWLVDGQVNILGISDRERNPRVGNSVALLNRIVYPSKNYDMLVDKVKEVLQRFVNYTGQKEGALSMQFFDNNGEIVVCEIAGRVLGHEHDLIRYCGGSNVNDLLLDYVYGDAENVKSDIVPMNMKSVSAGIYFLCEKEKYMEDLSQIEPMFNKYKVCDFEIFAEEGCVYNSTFPYLAKCYFSEDSREKINSISENMYKEIFVGDKEGNNIAIPFILESGR